MREIPEIESFLRDLPAFESLDDGQINTAARGIEIAYYRKGSDVFTLGDHNRTLNVVRAGALELRNSDDEIVLRLAEGDSFGFPSLMNAAPVGHRSHALEDSLVYHLDGDVFRTLRRESRDFDTYYIRALTDRLMQRPSQPSTFKGAGNTSVGSLIGRPPVTIDKSATILKTAQAMVDARVSSMLITDGGAVVGIVTDRDIRSRVVAASQSGDASVETVMTPSPFMLDANAQAYAAALVMMQKNIHHLPITRNGELIGMVSRSDFMRLETEHPLYLVSDIARQNDPAGIAKACERLPSLVLKQIESDADGEQLGQFITTVTDSITRQLIRIAESELGPAPCRFAWMALGSQARFEQSAKSDQDNALVYEDNIGSEVDDYFRAMAKIVNDGLDACGYVYCPGDVMASNPQWRQSLKDWKATFSNWITVPEQKALMHANIFFDLRCVHGEVSLIDELEAHIRDKAQKSELFLALMAKNALNFQPPLGFFRQFVLERSGEHRDTLDIKLHGVMPIVEIARIRALASGAMRVGTRSRLRAAASAGELTEEDAANLVDALDFIEKLRIEHQSRQMQAGGRPDNHLAPRSLSPFVRQNLKAAFSQVRTSQLALKSRFHIQ